MIFRHLDATLPKYLTRELGPDAMFGSVLALNPFVVVLLVLLVQPALQYSGLSSFDGIMIGTSITALSPFLLAFSPHASYASALAFVFVLSVGEAIWSPLLYDFTLSLCKVGKEGTYIALANAPLFMAALFAGALSGTLLHKYCPRKGPRHCSRMWLILSILAVLSPICIFLCRNIIQGVPGGFRANTEFKWLFQTKPKREYLPTIDEAEYESSVSSSPINRHDSFTSNSSDYPNLRRRATSGFTRMEDECDALLNEYSDVYED